MSDDNDAEQLANELRDLLNIQYKMSEIDKGKVKETGDFVKLWDGSFCVRFNSEDTFVDLNTLEQHNDSFMVIDTNQNYPIYTFYVTYDMSHTDYDITLDIYANNSTEAYNKLKSRYPDANIKNITSSDEVICNLDLVLVSMKNKEFKIRTSSDKCLLV